jgi:hypothetical protein
VLPLAAVFALALAAALLLYLRIERAGRAAWPLALLRGLAWGGVAALLVNPACAALSTRGTTVLLDGSASMSDPAGEETWRAAVDSARVLAGKGGRIIVFGTEPTELADSTAPAATASLLLPALREAAGRGGPVAIVTDGAIDDAAALPPDVLAAARVVVLPPRYTRGAGVAALDLPASLRAGDTALVTVDVVAVGSGAADTVGLELSESGRVVARARVPLGAGGHLRRELRFVPAPVAGEREVRSYEARLTGMARDDEPRDDARRGAAVVTRAASIAMVSDSPDWDFRWLARTLAATSGVPVRAFVRLDGGSWRETRELRSVGDAAVREELRRAALVVAHGGREAAALGNLASRALLRWPTGGSELAGDWYVQSPEFASPVGVVLAGVPIESLPPLSAAFELAEDSVEWTALTAQLERRGRSRPVVQGSAHGERRTVQVGATGFWRWTLREGIAGEAYRSLVAGLSDWLLEETGGARTDLAALRDSLAREGREFLPRQSVLTSSPGTTVAGVAERLPARHMPWVFAAVILALVAEWVARRRSGLR